MLKNELQRNNKRSYRLPLSFRYQVWNRALGLRWLLCTVSRSRSPGFSLASTPGLEGDNLPQVGFVIAPNPHWKSRERRLIRSRGRANKRLHWSIDVLVIKYVDRQVANYARCNTCAEWAFLIEINKNNKKCIIDARKHVEYFHKNELLRWSVQKTQKPLRASGKNVVGIFTSLKALKNLWKSVALRWNTSHQSTLKIFVSLFKYKH